MAEARQIAKMTIHFHGDRASQLARSFDDSFTRSRSFRDAMNETARTQRNIFVGGSLDDLRGGARFRGLPLVPGRRRR